MIKSKIKPEKCYIGSSKDIADRWSHHLMLLRYNKHHSCHLQRHFNKYGEADLQFNILLGCDKESLLSIEQYFLDSYRPKFNNSKKAGSPLGTKHTEESRKRMSEAHKGYIMPEEQKAKIRLHRHTEEAKKRISEKIKGTKKPPRTEEHKRKLSLANKGQVAWNKGLKLKRA